MNDKLGAMLNEFVGRLANFTYMGCKDSKIEVNTSKKKKKKVARQAQLDKVNSGQSQIQQSTI